MGRCGAQETEVKLRRSSAPRVAREIVTGVVRSLAHLHVGVNFVAHMHWSHPCHPSRTSGHWRKKESCSFWSRRQMLPRASLIGVASAMR